MPSRTNYRTKAGRVTMLFILGYISTAKAKLIQLNNPSTLLASQKNDGLETGYHISLYSVLWLENRVDFASPLFHKATPVLFHSRQLMSSRAKIWSLKYKQTNSKTKLMPRNKVDKSRMATSRTPTRGELLVLNSCSCSYSSINYPFSFCTCICQRWLAVGSEAPGGQWHIQQRFWLQEITFCLRAGTLGRILLLRCMHVMDKGTDGMASCTTHCWETLFVIYSILLLCFFTFYSVYFPAEHRTGW